MDLSGLVGNTGIASMIYYSGVILITVFLAGWYLNTRLHKICSTDREGLEKEVAEMSKKIDKIEEEYVRVNAYERDMVKVLDLVTELRDDIKGGVNTLTGRIDNLSLLFTRDKYGSR